MRTITLGDDDLEWLRERLAQVEMDTNNERVAERARRIRVLLQTPEARP